MSTSVARKLGSEGGENGDGVTPRGPGVEQKSDVRIISKRPDANDIESIREALEEAYGDGGEEGVILQEPEDESPFDLPAPEYHEGEINLEALEEAGRLLEENTLESHKKAYKILEESGILAAQRWEGIHTEEDPGRRHALSEVANDTVNPLVYVALANMNLSKGAVILELGSGKGRDLLRIAGESEADFIGVDSSQTAVHDAKYAAQKKDLDERVEFGCHNYVDVLETLEEADLDGIYGCSSLHYTPPLILKEQIFPMMAKALRKDNPETGEEAGVLCFAMKVATAASANNPSQKRLLKDDPYNCSVDIDERLFRFYPDSLAEIVELLKPSFEIIDVEQVKVEGYDKKGDVETFWHIVAIPRRNPTESDPKPEEERESEFGQIAA